MLTGPHRIAGRADVADREGAAAPEQLTADGVAGISSPFAGVLPAELEARSEYWKRSGNALLTTRCRADVHRLEHLLDHHARLGRDLVVPHAPGDFDEVAHLVFERVCGRQVGGRGGHHV